jgi:hypothetical protein
MLAKVRVCWWRRMGWFFRAAMEAPAMYSAKPSLSHRGQWSPG